MYKGIASLSGYSKYLSFLWVPEVHLRPRALLLRLWFLEHMGLQH